MTFDWLYDMLGQGQGFLWPSLVEIDQDMTEI